MDSATARAIRMARPAAERKAMARRAARARWSQEKRAYWKRLRQVQETACKSYVEATQALTRRASPDSVVLGRALRRLVAAFSNMAELAGVELPPDLAGEIGAQTQRLTRALVPQPGRKVTVD